MYGYLKTMPLSTRSYHRGHFLAQGGLAYIQSAAQVPRVQWGFSLFSEVFSSLKESDVFLIWISDKGYLNPESLVYFYDLPLKQIIFVQASSAEEVWKIALESVQTGIFGWAFIHASKTCSDTFLRKLQLSTEKTYCKVLTFNEERLPHWVFRIYLEKGNSQQFSKMTFGTL